jgi:hypothetical protein
MIGNINKLGVAVMLASPRSPPACKPADQMKTESADRGGTARMCHSCYTCPILTTNDKLSSNVALTQRNLETHGFR